jgi:hypothetical protein
LWALSIALFFAVFGFGVGAIPKSGGVIHDDDVSGDEYTGKDHRRQQANIFPVSPPSHQKPVCIIRQPQSCSQSSNYILLDESRCEACHYSTALDGTSCDGSLPVSIMSELVRTCLWVVYPLDPCFDLDVVIGLIGPQTASVLLGEEASAVVPPVWADRHVGGSNALQEGNPSERGSHGAALGFIAVKGDAWGGKYLDTIRALINQHTPSNLTANISKQNLLDVAGSTKFRTRMSRIPIDKCL